MVGTEESDRILPTESRPWHPAEPRSGLQTTLANIVETAAHGCEFTTFVDVLYRETSRAMDITGFILALYDEASQTVEVVRQIDCGKELPGGSFPLGQGFTSQVIRTRQPKLIRRWSEEGPPVRVQYATEHPGLPESGITVPLLVGDRIIGVLSVQSYCPEAFGDADLTVLLAVASHAAAAIETLRGSGGSDASLRRQVSELETILSSMSDALLIVDTDGRIVRLNRAAREILCLGEGTVVLGQPIDEERWGIRPLYFGAVVEGLKEAISALSRGEELRDLEVEVQGERRRTLSFNCAPTRDGDGTPTGGVIVFHDITGRREAERLKDEVLSIASHDLKAPVTTVKMQAQLLRRQIAGGRLDPDQTDKGLQTIVRQADRLTGLLDKLLDLSRLEAGRLELDVGPADLVALATTVVDSVQASTEDHQLILRAPERVEGCWDEKHLEQVLQNLLTNAVKYSPNGGTVVLTIEARKRSVTVRVQDNGIGLDKAELRRVFQQFYRATGTRRLEGTGLGLYICQGIVAAHGGRIWAESRGPGGGCTFCFAIPRSVPGVTPSARETA